MRYLLVGLGNIGKKRQQLLGNSCVATVDPHVSEATYRAISEVPTISYDAAMLSVPNSQKYAAVKLLVGAGKHVLVDKPITFTPSQYQEIAALAEANRVGVWTSYNHRFEPAIQRLKEHLDAGAIGTLYRARFLYGNGTVQNWIGTWRETPEGVIEDLGCHVLDMTLFLGISLNRAFSLFQANHFESRATELGLFGSTDGVLLYECSNRVWKNRFEIDLYGSKGSLHVFGLKKWGASTLEAHIRTFPSGAPTISSESFLGSDDSWRDEMLAFEKSLSGTLPGLQRDIIVSGILGSLSKELQEI